ASQTPSEDPARVGNFPSRSIAGLRKGGFGFFKPRRMVLSLCRSSGRGYALKFAVTAPGRAEALLYGVRESRSNSVEGMAYMRENWAPVCNEVRFREDRSE